MRPVCVPCRRFMRTHTVGYIFTEGMPIGGASFSYTNREPEAWTPYKIWAGDVYDCPECHAQVISGVGKEPASEHYKEDFQKWRELSQIQVDDC